MNSPQVAHSGCIQKVRAALLPPRMDLVPCISTSMEHKHSLSPLLRGMKNCKSLFLLSRFIARLFGSPAQILNQRSRAKPKPASSSVSFLNFFYSDTTHPSFQSSAWLTSVCMRFQHLSRCRSLPTSSWGTTISGSCTVMMTQCGLWMEF